MFFCGYPICNPKTQGAVVILAHSVSQRPVHPTCRILNCNAMVEFSILVGIVEMLLTLLSAAHIACNGHNDVSLLKTMED